jgi:hypothetical protein
MFQNEARYEIRVGGHLDQRWLDWFEGIEITQSFNQNGSPITVLTGTIVDQAALHGILARVRDIGIPIISVNRIESHEEE